MKLKLLELIKKHPNDYRDILTEKPYCLSIREDENYIIFKYNQIQSDFNLQIVREARGIIFDKNTWEVVCRAFDKFGNHGEGYADKIDWSTAKVLEKKDGCCDAQTLLITEDGEKTIKEICDTQYKGRIKGFDHERNEDTWATIVDYSVLPTINDWYKITFDDNTTIKLTGNHKIWIESLNCYRKVNNLLQKD